MEPETDLSTKKWIQDPLNSIIYLFILEILDQTVSYGYEIKQLVEKKINDSFSLNNVDFRYELKFSSLYTILRKLEDKFNLIKTVECQNNSSTKEKSRRCYILTFEGKRELNEMREEWKVFSALLKQNLILG